MWLYYNELIDESILEEYVGFVYQITNLEDDRKYIGKKTLKFKKTKVVKGKRKKFLVESDWKKYWGSNKMLHLDLEELGEDKFKREILRLCKSKGEMNYYEAKYQFESGALESDKYYNDWIYIKVHKSHLKKIDFSLDRSIMILAK